MADYVVVKGKRYACPKETETDSAARAAFIAECEAGAGAPTKPKATKKERK